MACLGDSQKGLKSKDKTHIVAVESKSLSILLYCETSIKESHIGTRKLWHPHIVATTHCLVEIVKLKCTGRLRVRTSRRFCHVNRRINLAHKKNYNRWILLWHRAAHHFPAKFSVKMAIILSTEPKMARWMITGRFFSSPSPLEIKTGVSISLVGMCAGRIPVRPMKH